jgi:hypothetical protein
MHGWIRYPENLAFWSRRLAVEFAFFFSWWHGSWDSVWVGVGGMCRMLWLQEMMLARLVPCVLGGLLSRLSWLCVSLLEAKMECHENV